MGLYDRLEEVVLHFDDELGVLSATGSGLAGVGLASAVFNGVSGSSDVVVAVTGLGLIALDYFR